MPLPIAQTQPGKVRRMPALSGSVKPLPASLRDVVTSRVWEASEAHAEQLARIRELRHAERVARDAAETARHADDAAAVAAVQAGKPVPDRTFPATLAEIDRATRAVPAAIEAARRTQFEFITALAEDQTALVAAAEEAIDGFNREAGELVDAIESLLVRSRDVKMLRAELEHDIAPYSKAQLFEIRQPRRGPLGPDEQAFLDGIRQAVAGA